jgi:GNAT superfamily N-acetyltransferase
MWPVAFESNPDIEELGKYFLRSPYFSPESLSHRGDAERGTSILIVRVWLDIAWALTFSVSAYTRKLEIWLAEVHRDYLWRWFWKQLLLEAEKLNRDNIDSCFWYLNNEANVYSKNMFLWAGYTQIDRLRFYKQKM